MRNTQPLYEPFRRTFVYFPQRGGIKSSDALLALGAEALDLQFHEYRQASSIAAVDSQFVFMPR
jgi:hypothetical protein